MTLLVAWGCSEAAPYPAPQAGTGGTVNATGGTVNATGGTANATGGTLSSTGGTTGGTTAATGGTPAATGGTPAGTGGGSGIPECVTAAMAVQCNTCHSTAGAPFYGGLDLSGDFLPRLLDKAATYGGVPMADMASCTPGAKLIDTATPENSVMLKKINGMQSCGNSMPSGGGMLTAAQKVCLQNWLLSF